MSVPARPPGRLVLVVGPSGAGKDTLIAGARAVLEPQGVLFVRRVVTRAASAFEDNLAVEPEAFSAALAAGDYALHWHAHGLSYALPKSVDDTLAQGRTVVANVSRGVIATARQRYGDVVAVLVTAPDHVLAARLAGRTRASDGPLEARLKRAAMAFDEAWTADVTIDNSTTPAAGIEALIAAIKGPAA